MGSATGIAGGLVCLALALIGSAAPPQLPLLYTDVTAPVSQQTSSRKLTGKFLHITDFHPDPFYKVYTSTSEEAACHRHRGPAGLYGAETTDCDSPFSLVNATFDWIDKNIKDDIDFIIWTGDSARHDNDEHVPRSEKQVIELNRFLLQKFAKLFGTAPGESYNSFKIPIIPTFGNNDILPHNIFSHGPNKWTRRYSSLWQALIPEEQRHQFVQGGWFYVEAIPNKLAIFSLNTLYFFGSNAAVDGCASKHEPGYQQMEWLRIQLDFMRQRGMKAILTGHVPPARNDEKTLWDETCWQKYTLWQRQYRDIIVGSLYGHMNIEHFILQDFRDIDIDVASGYKVPMVAKDQGDFNTVSQPGYLRALREQWSKLPAKPRPLDVEKEDKHKQSDADKFYKKIGGEFGERFSVAHVSASVVPNYFPSMRVFEYNITDLDNPTSSPMFGNDLQLDFDPTKLDDADTGLDDMNTNRGRKWKANFKIPKPPSKSAPPGPAYSPQLLSWIGYTTYYANLTQINNDFAEENPSDVPIFPERWKDGKHHGKHPKTPKPHPKKFQFHVEYDTRNAKDVYSLSINKTGGLNMRGWIDLATRIGNYNPDKDDRMPEKYVIGVDDNDADVDDFEVNGAEAETDNIDSEMDEEMKHEKKRKHRKHHKRRRIINRTWYAFASRAFVGSIEGDDLHDQFGQETHGVAQARASSANEPRWWQQRLWVRRISHVLSYGFR